MFMLNNSVVAHMVTISSMVYEPFIRRQVLRAGSEAPESHEGRGSLRPG